MAEHRKHDRMCIPTCLFLSDGLAARSHCREECHSCKTYSVCTAQYGNDPPPFYPLQYGNRRLEYRCRILSAPTPCILRSTVYTATAWQKSAFGGSGWRCLHKSPTDCRSSPPVGKSQCFLWSRNGRSMGIVRPHAFGRHVSLDSF